MATGRGGTGEEEREDFKKQEKGAWSSEVPVYLLPCKVDVLHSMPN